MLFGRYKEILRRLDSLERLVNLQIAANSPTTIMNQIAATQEVVRQEAQKLHERFSFTNRPRP